MNTDRFLKNLQHQAEDNPMIALSIGVAIVGALGKFIEQAGHAMGSRAYARDVRRRERMSRKS